MRWTTGVAVVALGLWAAGCECGGRSEVDAGGGDGGPGSDAGPRRDGGQGGTGDLVEGPVCSARGWCWEAPLFAGNSVFALATPAEGHLLGSASTFFFEVQPDGTVRHAWPPIAGPSPTPGSVWAASPDDAWIAASNPWTLLHFDGDRLTEDTGADVSYVARISGWASDDIWAFGFGDVYRYRGATWTRVDMSAYEGAFFNDLWAFGAGEALLVGRDAASAPLILHLRDDAITEIAFTGTGTPGAVWASSTEDIWLSTDGRYLFHLDGGTWTQLTVPTGTQVAPGAIWGSGPDDVWIGGTREILRWNGSALETTEVLSTLNAFRIVTVTGTSANDVWASDFYGQLLHWNGTAWSVAHKRALVANDFVRVAVGADGEGWAIALTPGVGRRSPDGAWTWEGAPSTTEAPVGVSRAGDEAFLFYESGAYRWTGSAWETVDGGAGLVDACQTDDGTIVAVGDHVARFTGGAFATDPATMIGPLAQVECVGDEAFGRGDPSPVMRWDGEGWGLFGIRSLLGNTVRDEVAPAAGDGWVVLETRDGAGIVMRDVGGVFQQIWQLPATVRGVGATGPDDVWLVGDAGLVRRWNGTSFDTLDVPGAPDLVDIGAGAGGVMLAVTAAAEVWERAGSTWTARGVALPAGVSSSSLAGVAFVNGTAFARGSSSEAFRLDGGGWTELSSSGPVDQVVGNDTVGAWFLGSYPMRVEGDALVTPDPSHSFSDRLAASFTGDGLFVFFDGGVLRWNGSAFASDAVTDGRIESAAEVALGYDPGSMVLVERAGSFNPRPQRWRRTDAWARDPAPQIPVGFGIDSSTGGRILIDADTSIFRQDGAGYVRIAEPRAGDLELVGAHAFDANDAWAVRGNNVWHYDGAAWTEEPIDFLVFRGWETAPDGTLFAVGRGGDVVSRRP